MYAIYFFKVICRREAKEDKASILIDYDFFTAWLGQIKQLSY